MGGRWIIGELNLTMKTVTYLLLLFSAFSLAQEKVITKSGTVSFEASVPSFEEVAATNSSVTAILNTNNGEVAALALVKGFRFKNALMEEHFNENYAESNKYPKATFKGKILNFNFSNITSDQKNYQLQGELEFRGKSVNLDIVDITLAKSGNSIKMNGNFTVLVSSFDIKIPSVVENKIDKEVNVEFSFTLN